MDGQIKGGYMKKMLIVNLSDRSVEIKPVNDQYLKYFLGGPGFGARMLYDLMPAHTDVFSEDSVIGFISGPLNNTSALFGGRYTVVSKSPVTNGWNDANSGGYFGERLKRSGYDAVFVKGIASTPVYLLIDNGKVDIRDAQELWGLQTKATEEKLMQTHGKNVSVALIGPGGENCSHIAAIMNDGHRAAARGGSGAVMGSKKLKAVVVKGSLKTPVAHPFAVFKQNMEIRLFMLKAMLAKDNPEDDEIDRENQAKHFPKYGTGGSYRWSIKYGDAGFKNWAGSNKDYTTEDAKALSSQSLHKYKKKKYHCPKCDIGCSIFMEVDTDRWGKLKTTRPEYETMGAFGSLMLNKDVESVIMANELCNEYGFDTMSAGSTIAWAMDCYANGLLTKEDLGGIELTWGNGEAVVALLELMGKNEYIGAVLAKGSRKAAEILNKGAEYLVVADGIEEPQHDARFYYGLGRTYMVDPTPGRHVKGSLNGTTKDEGFDPVLWLEGTGLDDMQAVAATEIMNACGACAFGFNYGNPNDAVIRNISAVTGISMTREDIIKLGVRIFTMRQAFNLREGIRRKDMYLSDRMKNTRPPEYSEYDFESLDVNTMVDALYNTLGWTSDGVPLPGTLNALGGLTDVIKDLYGDEMANNVKKENSYAGATQYYTGRGGAK